MPSWHGEGQLLLGIAPTRGFLWLQDCVANVANVANVATTCFRNFFAYRSSLCQFQRVPKKNASLDRSEVSTSGDRQWRAEVGLGGSNPEIPKISVESSIA